MRILMLLISLGQPLYTACDPLCENGIIMYAANRSLQYLTTPNYEKGFLPHNFTCSLVIKSIDSSRVWINIEELDMEFQVFDGCLDHITVLNTSSRVSKKEDRLAILCGLVNNISFVSNTEYMRVEVFTDMVISSRGARIAYRSLPDDECDDGWHEYKTKCFYLSPDTSEYSWAEAQNACVKQQSNLASVSQWIAYQDALLWLEGLNLTQSVWLGLSDIAREGYFSGLDGSHDFPFNWGSPNTFQNNDVNDCVYVNMSLTNVSDGDMFQLSDCRERRMFLCEKNKHGITWTAPDQTDSVRSAAQSWNFDFAFWILFFLTILLIILICSACALALKRHQRQSRVSATDDTTARAPVNTRSTTHSDPVGTVRAVNQDVPRNLPKPPESRRNIAVDTEANADVEQVVHQQTVVTPKEVISTARERLGVEDTSPNMEIPKGMIYVQSKNNIQKLNLNPSNLDGLQSRERTMMTMQTRDESFMRSKRAGDMFGRPKMTVLDNISAISLDEFWSNQSNIDQHDKNK